MTEIINRALSYSDIKTEFDEQRKIRIRDVLDTNFASELSVNLQRENRFETALIVDGNYSSFSESAWAKMDDAKRKSIQTTVMEQAANGVGFVYGRHPITFDEQVSVFKAFYDWINSDKLLQLVRDLTGFDDICKASVQATRYLPGQFLTRHKDLVEHEGRRIAYVVNLAPNWHPDWGGLLQFFRNDGTTTDAWSPDFNTLSFFDVQHIHSVTYITPYAKQARYALTGWFRSQ